MRNLLALVGLAVVVFLGLGWYLGWYSFVLTPGSDGGYQFQGVVKSKKIGEDVQQAREKVGKILSAGPTEATPPTQPGNEFVGPPLPSSLLQSRTQSTGRR